MAANVIAPPLGNSYEEGPGNGESIAESSPPPMSQEKLLEKLGLGSVPSASPDCEIVPDDDGDTNGETVAEETPLDGETCVSTPPSDVAESTEPCSNDSHIGLNGNCDSSMTKKEKRVVCQKQKVESLKEELHCEETKLLLLKKILESQTNKRNGALGRPRDQGYNKGVHPSLHARHSRPGSGSESGKVQIAPKGPLPSRGGISGSAMPRSTSSANPATNIKAAPQTHPYSGSASSKGNTVPTTMNSQNSSSTVRQYYIQVGSQLVPAAPSSSVYPQSSHYNSQSAHPQRHSESPVDVQASKQTAAKNALRRQLEQTLLQIPPPKPPPADWNTIPNVNSMDFMMLVGLDDIVDMILDLDEKPTMKGALLRMLPKEPYVCDQCNVDFSPAWKLKPNGDAGIVLCERCAVTNVKKDLKAEHTSRLKSAFIKALKQEQEIEEKIKAGEDVSFSLSDRSDGVPLSSVSYTQPQSSHGHQHSHQPANQSDRHRQVVHRHHHQVVQHYPRHTSLVHQLHQQHLQQQQPAVDVESSGSHHSSSSTSTSSRWHPYAPSSSHSHHSRIHTPSHGQSQQHSRHNYRGNSNGRHEYYVVHHPQQQHSNARWSR